MKTFQAFISNYYSPVRQDAIVKYEGNFLQRDPPADGRTPTIKRASPFGSPNLPTHRNPPESTSLLLPAFPPTSGNIVAIKVHHLVPRSREVLHKRLLRVVTRIDFRECPQLGLRTEHKIDSCTG